MWQEFGATLGFLGCSGVIFTDLGRSQGSRGIFGGYRWLVVLAMPLLFCAAHGASTTSSQLVHSFRNCDLSSMSTDEFCNYEEVNLLALPYGGDSPIGNIYRL